MWYLDRDVLCVLNGGVEGGVEVFISESPELSCGSTMMEWSSSSVVAILKVQSGGCKLKSYLPSLPQPRPSIHDILSPAAEGREKQQATKFSQGSLL
jgi:hypothetical protein